jgi:hypothetical protein
MLRSITLAALTLLAASPTLPQSAASSAEQVAARSYPAIGDIHWVYHEAATLGRSTNQLRFTHDGMNTSFGSDEAPLIMGEHATASLNSPGEAVSFTVVREAGALACTGRVESVGRASGTCRFDPDARFAAGLARRGLPPEDSDQVFALALVDAHRASVDGLMAQGFRFDDADDLVAVAALAVTPGYAGELRDAGLKIDDLDDLVAAKALEVNGRWLHEMAQAGYPALDVDRAIQMRALGVTPEYAMKMARVLRAVGEIE